jgi:hypothetical protein
MQELETLPGKARPWMLQKFADNDLIEAYQWVGNAWRFWWQPWKWNVLFLALKTRYYIRNELKRRLNGQIDFSVA